MFKNEHFLLNTAIVTVPLETTLEEVSFYLNKGTGVITHSDSHTCLFTPEDAALLPALSAANIQDLLEKSPFFLAESVQWDDNENLASHIPLTLSSNRPLLIKDKEGNIRGYSSLSDLLRAATLEQQKSASYFAALADTVTDAVTVVDRDGSVIYWNTVAEELYQLPSADILGKRIGEHFDVETLMVLKILDEGRMIRNTYHRPRPDTHVLINASPIRDAQGLIIGGIATEQDITQLVRLNEQLTAADSFGIPNKEQTEDLFTLIKGKGPAIGKVIQWAKKVAATETPVLLIGESGVGKEQLAHIIHQSSARSEHPFLTLNCGIVPAGLLEAELFGYQGGAFTGSETGEAGKLEQAKDGTLFINEIEKLPLDLQAKLYHSITQHTIVRLGGSQPIRIRTRIIIATTQDLAAKLATQEFRSDLYYALNVISIRIPPLRDRTEDIPAMVHMYLKQFSLNYQKPVPVLSPEVILALTNYAWPGNIQELKNVIERCVILSDEDIIQLEHLPTALQEGQPSLASFEGDSAAVLLKTKVSDEEEIMLIEEALAKTAGNKSAAAKLLGISRGTLYNKMKEFHME
ncbi:sigma 54-interacting transcriptional regulator [Paenibacillus chondroitinus]|uniref:Sigma 54-interacting transcriptional regulator n=1 Tax=Paenibacillus chondroitinus TaxID=59842 RepID=A0ABU6DEF5_9BACL|nr:MULTISPECIES: sigma 54-interacting transcriptional regulator [Paenibacillus]MCY9658646.1 sigma 54-interacting transcriptional regulator [Paenibacillus anseongense]MEB4796129.1 sigma 54-interacting transcriptional regulator [Paenibacillus chondroitinus]